METSASSSQPLVILNPAANRGKMAPFNPTADYSDGLFDICTIQYMPLLRALKLLPIVQKGEHAGLPEAAFYKAKSVYIEAQ